MNNEGAIAKLKESVNYYNTECPEDKVSKFAWERMQELTEVYQLAIAALEKQEPMKPEKIEPCNNGLRFGWCPKCDCSQVCETANYCKTCGQALDWGKDAE